MMARQPKRTKNRSRSRSRTRRPRTAKEFFAQTKQSQAIWARVSHVISRMRADGISLKEASGEFQIDPRTVIRRGGVALRKTAQGRYAARAHDQLLRVLTIPTLKGVDEIAI